MKNQTEWQWRDIVFTSRWLFCQQFGASVKDQSVMRNPKQYSTALRDQVGYSVVRRPAFSLMEMLVVISMIVLLISMLMPSLSGARDVARTAKCLSNARQIAVSWDNYTTDSNGYILEYTLQSKSRALWTQVLRPYFNDEHALLICPTTEDPDDTFGMADSGITGVRFGTATTTWVEARPGYNAPPPFNRSAYMYNGNMFSLSSYNTSVERYTKRTNIPSPERSPVLGDGVWRSATPGMPGTQKQFPLDLHNPQSGSTPANSDGVLRFVTNRHGKVTNVSFADTHAESVPLNNMWSLQWHRTYEPVDFID